MSDRQLAAVWSWLGLLLCAGVLVAALKPTGGASLFSGFDKVLHATVFAVLGGWFAALQGAGRRLLAVALGLAAFGAAIEGLQALTGRDPSFRDLAADLAGIGLGMWLLRSVTGNTLRYIEDRVRAATD